MSLHPIYIWHQLLFPQFFACKLSIEGLAFCYWPQLRLTPDQTELFVRVVNYIVFDTWSDKVTQIWQCILELWCTTLKICELCCALQWMGHLGFAFTPKCYSQCRELIENVIIADLIRKDCILTIVVDW